MLINDMKMIYEIQSLSKPSIVYNTGIPFSKKYKNISEILQVYTNIEFGCLFANYNSL